MAVGRRVRQSINLLFAAVIAAIGVIALINADSVAGRIFDIFVLAVGLIAAYLVLADIRRRRR